MVLSVLIGFYPLMYFLIDGKVGLLNSKPAWLLTDVVWRVAFYVHIVFGGIALLVGWMQFSAKLRAKKLALHRMVGKIYVFSVALSALSGFYMAFFANGGLWSSLGFGSLAVVWFFSTLRAYITIRKKRVVRHQIFMIYSYAACFAAVTLRIWLPLLIIAIGDFKTAYIIVAWWCWLPNLFVAWLITRRLKHKIGQEI